ncbi:MAG: DUF4351 domain-containing protein [Thiotrichaceae bacterium]|nr:DUF4351 domain-containing protein [Thiotrichaceae bacterium]
MMRLPKALEQQLWSNINQQLTKRFGTLPELLQERIKQADVEQLELWSDLILTASSLEEIFGNFTDSI